MIASIVLELSLYAAYLLAGPVVWVCFAIAMFKGRQRMTLIKPTRRPLPDPLPPVTILIPAKDEAQRIADCLRSALNQDYPNFSVITVNDRSTDATGDVMDDLASADPRLRVIHIRDGQLPPGWTGKCHALHTATSPDNLDTPIADCRLPHTDAETENQQSTIPPAWLLFVDSDVILQPHALATTIRVAEARRYDMVSLLPRLQCQTFWERLLVPLAGTALSMLYLVALTNANHRATAFANGQFILIRRSAYNAIGGHAAVRDQFCEDIEMARLIKRQGLRPRISWGADLAAVRMYSSLPSIRRGWARIFFAGSFGRPWRILVGIAFILLSVFSLFPAAAWSIHRCINPTQLGPATWLSAAAVHWTLMTILIAISYAWSGNRRRNALLLPLGAAMLLGIFARALWMGLSGHVEWRGTRYASAARKGRLTTDPLPAPAGKPQTHRQGTN